MSNDTQVTSKTQHQVTINGNGVTHVIYKDQPVLTFAMIDQLHQRPDATARKRFHDNVARFIENEDFYLIDYSEKSVLRTFGINIPPRGLTVLTQTGYAMLAKVFTDKLAWQVQRELVNKYFVVAQPVVQSTQAALSSQVAETFKAYAEICECIGIIGNAKTLAANQATVKLTGTNPLENMGMTHLIAQKQEQLLTISTIAKELGVGVRKVNPILIGLGLQTKHEDYKNRVYYELSKKGKQYAQFLDTGKKHSNGAPVTQIKWYSSVLEFIKNHLADDFELKGEVLNYK